MIFSHYPSRFRAQKGGFSGAKTRYNRLKNHLSDICLSLLLFSTRGEFKAIFIIGKRTQKGIGSFPNLSLSLI
jgi:hypothetical protein